MFIGGVQLISLGVAGAYIAKIYEGTKARPVYIVRELHGLVSNPEITLRKAEHIMA